MINEYYRLTKPGIVWSNVMAAAAGFLFASAWHFQILTLLATLIGTALIIACACVFNNFLDRNIDKKMARTKKRALVSGVISARNALIYATTLGILGFAILGVGTNALVFSIGAIGLFFYVIVYGIAKRKTVHGTLIGTISGSMPILAGYVAVTNQIDVAGLLLVAVLTTWQMAHFFSIAIYRVEDYRAAGLPLLPVVKGIYRAKVEVLVYVGLFALSIVGLSLWSSAGVVFVLAMLPLSGYWAWAAFRDYATDSLWGRQMFGQSLAVLLTFCAILSVSSLLP